jgi:chromosome segregation ATPase
MARQALIACALIPLILIGGQALAADSSDAEVDQLRAQLNSTVIQLRQLQDQMATTAAPPAAPAPAADSAALKSKLGGAQRALRAEHAKSAALQTSLTQAQAEQANMTAAAAAQAAELKKYQDAYAQAAAEDQDLAHQRDGLTAQLTVATNVATACQAKNAQLTQFIHGVLAADRKMTTTDVVLEREPLFGFRRVQLENIAQDREDAIRADHCDTRLDAVPQPKPTAPAG